MRETTTCTGLIINILPLKFFQQSLDDCQRRSKRQFSRKNMRERYFPKSRGNQIRVIIFKGFKVQVRRRLAFLENKLQFLSENK